MKKMRDVPESDRPREKIAKKGVSSLSDSELVEVILGRGTKDNDVRKISKEIVDLIGRSPHGLQFDDLLAIKGIGPSKASQILACYEIGRRFFKSDTITRVTKPEDILPLMTEIRQKRQEHFVCLTLN